VAGSLFISLGSPMHCCRSHDGQLLVVSSTDGYCTLITFDENELGTIYKKCEPVEVLPPVKPANQTVERVLSPVKPANQIAEHLSEARIATTKEYATVQPLSVTDPAPRDHSPQRKKARRVVLQTLSTNVEQFIKAPCEMSSKAEVTKNVAFGDKRQTASSHADDGVDGFNHTTNYDVTTDCKPECVEVCEGMQVTEVGLDLC